MVGRGAELDQLRNVLARASEGHSGVVTVRGEAGIGKTMLLEHARDVAESFGFEVEFAAGSESETEFAFAGLHALCAGLLESAEALPEPQQAALGVAFGLRSGAVPDRFVMGLATLNLLAEAANDHPVLWLVDDAQWLDQASAEVLAFVARRMDAERVALLLGIRDSNDATSQSYAGLPELRLQRLNDHDARKVLSGAVGAPLDDVVRNRIVAEAQGNPLALTELLDVAQPATTAAGFVTPHPVDIPRRLEENYWQRSLRLPQDAQLLLLVAAADPTGEPALLWRAAEHLGLPLDSVVPAEGAGLLQLDTRVRFRHPLVRSAVYGTATPPDRRRAHQALAVATDPLVDPDRHAWHRAQSVVSTDEDAASQLEDAAGRAQSRGGVAAAAAFLQRAAELSFEPDNRARRALQAAQLKSQAGAWDAALNLLAVAEAGPKDPLRDAQIKVVRAQVAFHQTLGRTAPWAMLEAAKALTPLNAPLARATYLHAINAATIVGVQDGKGFREVAHAALAAPPPPHPPRPLDLLLDGLSITYTEGIARGIPPLRQALEAFRANTANTEPMNVSESQLAWLACRTALVLFDDELVDVLADNNVHRARAAGALYALPAALLIRSMTLVLAGELSRADELATEQASISQAIGGTPLHLDRLMLSAWRGREPETTSQYDEIRHKTAGREEGTEAMLANYILAVLHNGLGNYPAAASAASQACRSGELGHSSMALPELIEAAVRAGDTHAATKALDQFAERAVASGTEWALGLLARSQALTVDGSDAEALYREAITRLSRTRMTAHLARTHLVFGEWLRREGRRKDAREHLGIAHHMLSEMGAGAFAARAARELRATGEHPRKRTAQPSDLLTPHELQIARLVATGATSREVAAQLFLSPRTIEAHLRTIFRKLGITSRRQLKDRQLG
jgi:DNA-binding CsgD family transcriptional regulator